MATKKSKTPKERVIYTIVEIQNEDGTYSLRRENHGVDAHRLHSILMFATNDVARQISHELLPPQRVVVEKKK